MNVNRPIKKCMNKWNTAECTHTDTLRKIFICSAYPCFVDKNIYLPTEDLRRGTRLMVSTCSQMKGCAPVPTYALLLGMLCSAQVPTETTS